MPALSVLSGNRRQFLASIVALSLVVTGVQAFALPARAEAAPAAVTCSASATTKLAAQRIAAACDAKVSVSGLTTQESQTWAMPDGAFAARVYDAPVRIKDSSGTWVPVNTTLRRNTDGSVSAIAHPADLWLSGAVGAGSHDLVRVTSGAHTMSVGWIGALPTPTLTGSTATYTNVKPGINLVVAATRTGFETSLIVANAAAAAQVASLTLPIDAPGLSMTTDAYGNMSFKDATGKVVGTSGAPEMWDASLTPQGLHARHEVVPTTALAPMIAGETQASTSVHNLTLRPDLSFITNKATRFPVTIDPTVNPLDSSWDTYVQQGDTVDRSGDTDMQLGFYGGATGPARALLEWPTTQFEGQTITSAQTFFYNYFSESCTQTEWDMWLTGSRPSGTVLWTNQPTWTTNESSSTQTKGFSAACDDGWTEIDGKNFFQAVANADASVGHMGLRVPDETYVYSWKQMRSRNADDQDQVPYTNITYQGSPAAGSTGTPKNATQLKYALTDRLSAEINVASGNLLVESADLTMPGISGDVTLGASYNSLLAASGEPAASGGAFGAGWKTLSGIDVKLIKNSDSSVTYVAPGGDTGTFQPSTGSNYTSPSEFQATLTGSASAGWTLNDHAGGTTDTFNTSGILTKIQDRSAVKNSLTGTTFSATQIATTRGGGTGRTENLASITTTSGQITKYSQTGDSGIGTRQVLYSYSVAGAQLQKITEPTGQTITFGYTGTDLTTITVTAPGGAIEKTTIGYDGSHRVIAYNQILNNGTGAAASTRLMYASSTSTLVAGPTSNQSQAVNVAAHTTYTVNANTLRVTKSVDPLSNSRSDTYTSFNDVLSATDGLTYVTQGTYTDNGGESLNDVASPTGASTSLSYASTPAATKYEPQTGTDSQGNASSYGYDGAGNMASATNASAAASSVQTNLDGTPETSTDPSGAVTNYTYTDHELTKITPPTGTTLGNTVVTWDGYGRLLTRTDGRGLTQTYAYDTQDHILSVTYSDGTPPVHYTYDGFGNVSLRTDASGSTSYGFDTLNRMVSRTAGNGGTETWVYDNAGNVTAQTDANGTVQYTFDADNQEASMTTTKGTLLQYKYNANGKRTDTYFVTNSANTTWAAHTVTSYDHSSRITEITTTVNSSSTNKIEDLSYTYGNVNGSCSKTATVDGSRIHSMVDHVANLTTTYCYDTSNRLTSATLTGSQSKTYSYTYDSRGNRKTAGSQTLTYNVDNEITNTGYSYDAAGNQTKDPTAGTLVYNAANQMIAQTGTSNSTYTYAGTDQRELTHEVVPGGATLDYTYGRADQYGDPEIQSIRKSGAAGPDYLDYDATGSPQVLTTSGGAEVFYDLDGLGSPVNLVKTTGVLAGSYAYDPYGTYTDTNLDGGSATGENAYRYAISGTYDRGTGFIKDGNRYYNPTTGRFTQQDTITTLADPGEANLYAYAGDDPNNNVDPTGRSCWAGALLGAFGGGGALEVFSLGAGAIGSAELTGAVLGLAVGLTVGFGIIGVGLLAVGVLVSASDC